jgi:hypothetical protein
MASSDGSPDPLTKCSPVWSCSLSLLGRLYSPGGCARHAAKAIVGHQLSDRIHSCIPIISAERIRFEKLSNQLPANAASNLGIC